MATPTHSMILTAAARKVLRPMGLSQKGRSRTWLDDHGWWVCVVEFQPSSWSRGSYLNVGCMWLWSVKDYISFDEGHRVESFAGFQNETQFEPEALRLGQRAAAEVQRYRTLFPNVESVCKYYLQRPLKSPRDWQNFHSGVACALAGNLTDAVRFFDLHLIPDPDQPEWFVDRQADAKNLKELAPNLAQFRSTIANRVRRARELQKLPPWAVLDFDGPSHP